MAYKKIKNFRFWCQKVLPLVYDDSLSYYEVLCKIRDYINDIIADMDELSTLIQDLDSRVDALEDELEHISQSIIEEIKKYLNTEEFISNLVEALGKSETFNKWFKEFLTNNEEVIRDLINSDYFDQYFKDYFTNNTDLINQLLSSDAFNEYFQNAFDEITDFYDIKTVAGDSIQSGGLTSNYYAIGKNSSITAGTRLKVMYAPTLTPIVGKFQRTESGGFYNYASDGDTAYTSFIIDLNGYSGRNLYFYIAESFEPFSMILVKRGSLDTGGVSITSDKASATMQVAYVPSTWTSNYVQTTKKVNYAIVSIKNNGVAFNPIFAYSIRNVDYDANTDKPIMLPYNIYAVWDGASDTPIQTMELYKPKNDLAFIIFGMLGSTQYGLNEEVNVVDSTVSNMQEDIEELKNSVSDGKALVASAITDKGIATASDASFGTMASNILEIPTGDAKPGGLFTGSFIDITNDLSRLVDYGFTHIPSYNSLVGFYNALMDANIYCKPVYSQDVLSAFIICADANSEVGIRVSETSSNNFQYERYYNQQLVVSDWDSTTGTQECYVYHSKNGTSILIPVNTNWIDKIDARCLILGHCYNVTNRLSFFCNLWFGDNYFLYDGCTGYNQGSFNRDSSRLNRNDLLLATNLYGTTTQSIISNTALFTFYDLFLNKASLQTGSTELVKSYLFVGDNGEVFFLPSSLTTNNNYNICYRIK